MAVAQGNWRANEVDLNREYEKQARFSYNNIIKLRSTLTGLDLIGTGVVFAIIIQPGTWLEKKGSRTLLNKCFSLPLRRAPLGL